MAESLGVALLELGTDDAKLKRGLSKAEKSTRISAERIKTVFASIVGIGAVIATARTSIAKALNFDAALAETSTLIEGSTQQLDFLRDSARDMAREFGGTGTAQIEAFYQAISAGSATVEEASTLLRTANQFAIGGATDLVTAVDILTTAVNVYGEANLSASDAADVLFVGIKAGKTTADELGAAIGNVAGIAEAAGLSFDQLVAGIASLTAAGIKTNAAVTGMRAILAALLKPTSEAVEEAERLGIEFNTAALQAKGLSGFLQDLFEKTGQSKESLALLFGGVEALIPILSFAGKAGDKLSLTMEAMADRTGAATEAYEKISESLSQRFRVQLASAIVLSEKFGTLLLEILVPALELAAENIELLTAALVVFAVTQIPRALVTIANITTALLSMGSAAKFATVAMRILGGPFGILLGIAAAVIIKFDAIRQLFGLTADAASSVEKSTDNVVLAMGDEIRQSQLLSGVLGKANIISLDAARVKLAEARARLTNAANAITEARILATTTSEARGLASRIKEEVDLIRGLTDPDIAGTDRLTKFEKDTLAGARSTLVALRIIQKELLADDERLIAHAQQVAKNFKIVDKAIFETKGDLVEFGDAIVDPIKATERLGDATEKLTEDLEDEDAALAKLNAVLKKNAERQREAAEAAAQTRFEIEAVTDDIIGPFKDALKDGQLNFESFASALESVAIRMKDRMIDEAFKPLEEALDAFLLKLAGAGSGGGSGSILGKIIGGAFAALGGGGGIGSGTEGAFANLLPGGSGRVGGGREHGGPVQAGRAFIVGERRPELFIPSTSGTILPRVPSGGLTVNINQPIDARGAVEGTAEQIQSALNENNKRLPDMVRNAQRRGL